MSSLTNFCTGCNESHPVSNFEKYPNGNYRKQCKAHRRKVQKEKNALSTETKTCRNCGKIGLKSEFHGALCKSCKRVLASGRRADEVRDTDDGGRQRAIDTGKFIPNCTKCQKDFNTADFLFDTSKRSWKGRCKDCDDVTERSRRYREKFKATDIDTFQKTQRVYAQNFRVLHPEKGEEYNQQRRTNTCTKWKALKLSASYRDIQVCEEEEQVIAQKFKLPCNYCGYKDETNLNGVDRLDNTGVYSNENTVPCCSVCNRIKGDLTLGRFLGHVSDIVKSKGYESPHTDRTLPKTRFGIGRRSGNDTWAKPKDFLGNQIRKNMLIGSECYICGSKSNLGIDRIDSAKHYTKDNSKPCCSPCNYMKSDFDLGEFLQHVCAIYEHSIITEDASNDTANLDYGTLKSTDFENENVDYQIDGTSEDMEQEYFVGIPEPTIVAERSTVQVSTDFENGNVDYRSDRTSEDMEQEFFVGVTEPNTVAERSTAEVSRPFESTRAIALVILKDNRSIAKYGSWRALGLSTGFSNIAYRHSVIKANGYYWENYQFVEIDDLETFNSYEVNSTEIEAFEAEFKKKVQRSPLITPVCATKDSVRLEYAQGDPVFPTIKALASVLKVSSAYISRCLKGNTLVKGYSISHATD